MNDPYRSLPVVKQVFCKDCKHLCENAITIRDEDSEGVYYPRRQLNYCDFDPPKMTNNPPDPISGEVRNWAEAWTRARDRNVNLDCPHFEAIPPKKPWWKLW